MRRRTFALAAVAPFVAAAAGCGSSSAETAGKSTTKITYVTAFGTVGRDAFAWVAQDKGWFKDAGLDVTIKPGAGTGEDLKLVSSGQADFMAGDLTGVTISEGSGTYSGIRAFAALHQRTLVSIISLKKSNISRPKDLDGKTIAQATASVNKMLFPAYAKLTGIDASTVHWQDVDPTQLAGLLATGRVDALSTFLIGQRGIEAVCKQPTVMMPFSDYLTDLYGNALFTTDKMIKDNPTAVKKFRDVMLRALQYSIKNAKESANILHKYEPAADVTAAVGEIELMAPYVSSSSSGVPVGAIDSDRVARVIALLRNTDLVKSGTKPTDVVDFTLTPKK
jgi:NitT/TauT family transport system substrate-binding protein